MSKQEIKAIETMPDGKQKALDKDDYTTLGYYDTQRNATIAKDGYTKLATGNVLSSLTYQKR